MTNAIFARSKALTEYRIVDVPAGAVDLHTLGEHHVGTRYVGDISVEFDRRIVDWMRAGEGHRLAQFSSSELIENGEGELRQWIVLLGALGAARPEFLVYEPLFRSIMGKGVGYWNLEDTKQ